ncbi:MAG: hypothetical protein ACPL7D_01355 [Candidatus Sumerlaeaceae bacterium]|jgi:hypothetical protein
MSLQDTVSDAFGLILLGSAAILTWWEIAQQRNPERDVWFVTPRRLRRRLVLSGLLGLIGLILTLEARKVLPIRGVGPTLVYAAVLGGLTLFLLIISLADIADTLNCAARKSLSEMDRAILAQKQAPERASETSDDKAPHS